MLMHVKAFEILCAKRTTAGPAQAARGLSGPKQPFNLKGLAGEID